MSASGTARRSRSGDLRLCGVHVLLGAFPQGALGDVVQDTAGEPETGQAGHRRLGSAPSGSVGGGATRRALSTPTGALQLLPRQRQPAESAATPPSPAAGLG